MAACTVDLIWLVLNRPASTVISYRGRSYRYYCCAECGQWFWKSTTDRYHRAHRIYRIYCGQVCFKKGQTKLTAARQKRYRIAYDTKYGKGTYSRRMKRYTEKRNRRA